MVNKANIMTRWTISLFFTVLVGAATVVSGSRGRIPTPNFFYVDAVHGNDDNRGLTPGAAFATIQRGIDTAADNDIVLVYPGLYQEEINFLGKALVVQGATATADPASIPVLQNPGDFAVSFYSGEGPDSILENFVIRGSFMAVFIARSSPTISNVTIVDNTHGIEAYVRSEPDISNCIFWRNAGGDLFGCQAKFSRTSEAGQGQSNIIADPLFVDPNAGDYHLLSERGRYWSEHDVWVLDRVTSPCIDRGNPNADPSDEPIPNGDRINMGAYGGTVQASMSPELLPGLASNPSPSNGAVEVDINAILSWDPGPNALLHDVHFGTENPPPLVSSQAMPQFDPGRMNSETVYYWRIDEVDSEGNETAGAVWEFTTTSGEPPKGRACFIPETGVWVDGALVSISKVGVECSISWADGVGIRNSSLPLSCRGKVEEVQEHEGIFECFDVLLESGNRIGVAERHYFLIESGNWVAVQNLKTGTKLQTPRGSIAIVNVAKRLMPYAGKVYNLKVAGSDRYLVGRDAIIVRDH
ncbi:MAG: hypothetical protein CEE38_09705 [Planctomycetes bacterium B3_Pla]|nr:MAG: hypothetical protein CEE38_09705 [Planctomycetes bacterium B3_Pla]